MKHVHFQNRRYDGSKELYSKVRTIVKFQKSRRQSEDEGGVGRLLLACRLILLPPDGSSASKGLSWGFFLFVFLHKISSFPTALERGRLILESFRTVISS